MSYRWSKDTTSQFPTYTAVASHFGNVANVRLVRICWPSGAEDNYLLTIIDKVASCCFDIAFSAKVPGAAVVKANAQLRRWNVIPQEG